MPKIWDVNPRTEKDLISHLLKNRGISESSADSFLNPDYGALNDPFLFADMKKAAERILQAVARRDKILIYSDYDADAVTANAALFRTLKFLGSEPEVYIPDRFSEGYGLNLEAFEKIKARGIKLVITVDCGTNSVSEAAFCRANGIDLIITDHHEITAAKPNAFALINPKNPDEKYPYHELTGVAVAWKLASALLLLALDCAEIPAGKNLPRGFEKWLLDLVAIGTIADCHSLLGENRILVKYGLQVLGKTKWVGLRALIKSASPRTLDAHAVAFMIAPRINAAGRIEHARIAFDLLVCDNPELAGQMAEELERLNAKRQMLTETVMSEARAQIAGLEANKVLLACGNDWPKGVVGLVAGRLAEEFGKPVLVMEKGAEHATGSARSVSAFNIVKALSHSKEFLVKYGGHAAAAGFTLRNADIDFLYRRILEYADENLASSALEQYLQIEAEIFPAEINFKTFEDIERMAPFGAGNSRPRLALMGAVVSDLRTVGKDNAHLQLGVRAGGQPFKCIGFNFGWAAKQISAGERIDLAFEMLSDEWNGFKNLKLRILDFRKTNG